MAPRPVPRHRTYADRHRPPPYPWPRLAALTLALALLIAALAG